MKGKHDEQFKKIAEVISKTDKLAFMNYFT